MPGKNVMIWKSLWYDARKECHNLEKYLIWCLERMSWFGKVFDMMPGKNVIIWKSLWYDAWKECHNLERSLIWCQERMS